MSTDDNKPINSISTSRTSFNAHHHGLTFEKLFMLQKQFEKEFGPIISEWRMEESTYDYVMPAIKKVTTEKATVNTMGLQFPALTGIKLTKVDKDSLLYYQYKPGYIYEYCGDRLENIIDIRKRD